MPVENINSELQAIKTRSETLQAIVDAGDRELSDEEISELETMSDRQTALMRQRDAIGHMSTISERHDSSAGRRSDPGVIVQTRDPQQPPQRPSMITGGEPAGSIPGARGFRSIAEFGVCVADACMNRRFDPRLPNPMSIDAQGNETRMQNGQSIGVGIEGGYLVPPTLVSANVEKLIGGDENLFNRAARFNTLGNIGYWLVNEQAPWESGAVTAYWEGERTVHTASDADFAARVQRLAKLTVFVRVTEEALDDAALLGSQLEQDSPLAITWKMNDALINGDGVGKPLGFLQSPGLVVVPKETSQAAATVVAENIVNMWGRMYAAHRAGAVWIMNQDVEQQLQKAYLPVKNVAGSENVGGWPVYTPANGLSGNPFDTLYNREIIYLENMQALGTQGDILLTNLAQYQTLRKVLDAVDMQMSVHLYFDRDEVAFKWRIRVDGAPKWRRAMPRANAGSQPLSNHIALATRA